MKIIIYLFKLISLNREQHLNLEFESLKRIIKFFFKYSESRNISKKIKYKINQTKINL